MGQRPTKLLPMRYGTASHKTAANQIWDSVPQAAGNKIWDTIPTQSLLDAASPLAFRENVTAQGLT